MTFPEIFDKFKNQFYIRRKCWHEKVFIQCDSSLIKQVQMEEGYSPSVISKDIRLSATDLLGDDWVVMDEHKTFWDYIDSLDKDSDEWRYAMELGQKYYDYGMDPNICLKEIKDIINKK